MLTFSQFSLHRYFTIVDDGDNVVQKCIHITSFVRPVHAQRCCRCSCLSLPPCRDSSVLTFVWWLIFCGYSIVEMCAHSVCMKLRFHAMTSFAECSCSRCRNRCFCWARRGSLVLTFGFELKAEDEFHRSMVCCWLQLATTFFAIQIMKWTVQCRDVTNFKSKSCQISTNFCKLEMRWIFRLIYVGFEFNFRFGKPSFSIHHSPVCH